MAEIIEIKRKPTARQIEALRTALANPEGIVEVSADKRTHEGLVGRGLADWKRPETVGLGRSVHGTALCVITRQGRDYLAKLDGAEITREDVEEGKRQALAWLGFGERRREAEQAPASVVLKGEFERIRRVMRRAMRQAGAEAANNALNQYNRTHALLLAARKFEAEDAAQEAAQEGSKVQEQQEQEPREFRGLTRADVAHDAARALETLSAEDRATVEGKAPSVILGMAFRRAQRAWCADRRERTAEESAAYERCANIASAALIFERADDPEAAEVARTDDWRITTAEREAERKRIDEAHARALEIQWRGAERHGKYLVRTEEVGADLVRVYVRGPHTEVNSIERASLAYARGNGLRPGASAGGGEFFNGEYIAQCAYNRA